MATAGERRHQGCNLAGSVGRGGPGRPERRAGGPALGQAAGRDNAGGVGNYRLIGEETAVGNDRNSNGTFAPGNPGGPGRPRRATERQYLAAFAEAVPLSDWRAIIQR